MSTQQEDLSDEQLMRLVWGNKNPAQEHLDEFRRRILADLTDDTGFLRRIVKIGERLNRQRGL